MSALAIESQVRVSSAPGRLAPTRPATRRPERRPASMPQFSSAVPLRSGRASACSVAVPQPTLRRPVGAQEWQLTQRGLAVCVGLMSLVAVLSVVTLVVQYLAIPA